ncbi:hypothetical protein PT015_23115 [Candidatus Mycobacterium wuenschmannii]|uniref:Secreted protein n=1 Tax=Candidatus Mycobacterium wuenschmannii TaxID=3027808 RepID=A0ABY8VXE8_9MYCO|nr:hypothetical protein [Candidatus Mycobacterium wuenschmannii]WIM87685.1 hypothetical protein PT015_23115 [Candidatus Mycobacterium wuenschmannii]
MTVRMALPPAVRGILAAALLVCAGAMWSLLPTKLQSWAPIDVHGQLGQRITGRDIAVTVARTYLARAVTAKSPNGLNVFSTKGVWLVMMVSYEPLFTPQSPHFDLRVGDSTYDTNLSGFHSMVQPGMPLSSPMAFELPTTPTSATLLVSNVRVESSMAEMDTAPLDSRVAVDMSLSGLVPVASLNLDELADR